MLTACTNVASVAAGEKGNVSALLMEGLVPHLFWEGWTRETRSP
jgi:hypothetical protein